MLYVDLSREALLPLMPKGGTWCEVGVFRGVFSKEIVANVQPDELHLVDVWKWIYYDWNNPPAEEARNIEQFKKWMKNQVPNYDGGNPEPYLEGMYQELCRFAETEQRTAVRLHRGRSVEMAKTFPDRSFDLVYLDADHHYDAVLGDLFAYADKVKEGGILMGDDFLDDLSLKDGMYGTIDAVNTFIKRSGYKCLMITGVVGSQYVLYRESSPYVQTLASNVFNTPCHIIEIADALLPRFAQKGIAIAGKRRFIPSFV
jgi:hypothetical protein